MKQLGIFGTFVVLVMLAMNTYASENKLKLKCAAGTIVIDGSFATFVDWGGEHSPKGPFIVKKVGENYSIDYDDNKGSVILSANAAGNRFLYNFSGSDEGFCNKLGSRVQSGQEAPVNLKKENADLKKLNAELVQKLAGCPNVSTSELKFLENRVDSLINAAKQVPANSAK